MDKVRKSDPSNYLRAVCVANDGSAITVNTTRANTSRVTNHHFNVTLNYEQTAREAQSEVLGDRQGHAVVGQIIESDALRWEHDLDQEHKTNLGLKTVNLGANLPAEVTTGHNPDGRKNYDGQLYSGQLHKLNFLPMALILNNQGTNSNFAENVSSMQDSSQCGDQKERKNFECSKVLNANKNSGHNEDFDSRQQFEFKRLTEEIQKGHKKKQKLHEGVLPGFHSFGVDIHTTALIMYIKIQLMTSTVNERAIDASHRNIYDRTAQTYIPANPVTVAVFTAPNTEREVTPAENEDFIVGETYFGYIEDQADALAVIEATIAKILVAFTGSSVDMSQFKVRSGSVAVIPESCRFVKRWRDGLKWSPSRVYGPFLLYRQIESVNEMASPSEKLHGPLAIPGVEPLFTSKTLKAGTQIVDNGGLTKRSISMKGSDGQRYRVISYYTPKDVIEMHKQTSVWRHAKQNANIYTMVLNSVGVKTFRKAFHDAQFARMIESREFAALLEKNISGCSVKANITPKTPTYPPKQPQSFELNHQQNFISQQVYAEHVRNDAIFNSRITPPAIASNYLSRKDEEYYAKIYEPYGYNNYYPYNSSNGYFHHQQFEKVHTRPFDRDQREYQRIPLQYSRNWVVQELGWNEKYETKPDAVLVCFRIQERYGYIGEISEKGPRDFIDDFMTGRLKAKKSAEEAEKKAVNDMDK
ncbi:hypothetical protein HK100_006399 [Physocladia obscura]|uniref:Uncharacterized protein n=1 Tax=Physocladia obscura TaxID=109957 RepID=A0AAD5X7J1_9FUNG|nr:hypothetical protein HK100_006399 [Physocladia obscura]